MKTLKSDQLSN